MRLLVTTQKVERADDVLGFFHRWLIELSKRYETVTVICLYEGTHELPPNVRVVSLGKESGVSRLKYVTRLYRYLIRFHSSYDAVLVHMNPEYIVLAGWWWRLTGKTIALWYTHRQVNAKLKVATLFAHIIFSSTPYSFRINTSKAHFIGHGVAVEEFAQSAALVRNDAEPLIVTAGRITPIKNIDTLIEAVARVYAQGMRTLRVAIIGAPLTASDHEYAARMKALVASRGLTEVITFVGAVQYEQTKEWFARASLAVNMVPPGGLDKVVIEAAAAGCPTLTSNIAYAEVFQKYALTLTFKERDPADLARTIELFFKDTDRIALRAYVASIAQTTFSVEAVIEKIATGIDSVHASGVHPVHT
jgi:glycosyltransferase involved in cell wall biosynthesis